MANNTLPESIKKRIEDEAEAKNPYTIPQFKSGWREGYSAAAEGILQNPGDYDLINREGAVLLFQHYMRYRSEPDSKLTFEEWLGSNPSETLPSESAAPSDRVQQLEQVLREAQKWCDETDYDEMPA